MKKINLLNNAVSLIQKTLWLSVCLSMTVSAASAPDWPTAGWPVKKLAPADDLSYLSALEKNIILHLNMARTDPSRYSKEFIAPRSAFYNNKMYLEPGGPENFIGLKTQEGVSAVDEAATVMNSTKALGSLKAHKKLTLAAQDHATDQSKHGGTGHVSHDGSTLQNRVERHGKWQHTIGENIIYGPDSGREVVVGLLVDDGVKNRGHRTNILKNDYKIVGVACAKHSSYRIVCVMDFAGGME
ncbi:CAP domain-containing protein [Psychromonas sp. MB-3u-54]|uniref:CAP domain-containing protein n=1 Tax=Psychromonas sp. MB-3u-54 TaxID=2058319 RepID=UPI000C345281|nr:CAP domain-containing protein [Psychromonas sp. MB-3u-54]PKH04114.1 CAP domain-containing protein [Psychromonas sp. MB-3u-54]